MTLGVSPVVNSCSDPFAAATSWARALSSRRKFPAHCIESPSLLFALTEHLTQPRFQHRICRALAASVQPVFKVLDFDDMGDLGISNLPVTVVNPVPMSPTQS